MLLHAFDAAGRLDGLLPPLRTILCIHIECATDSLDVFMVTALVAVIDDETHLAGCLHLPQITIRVFWAGDVWHWYAENFQKVGARGTKA